MVKFFLDFVQVWVKLPKQILYQSNIPMGHHDKSKMKQLGDGSLEINNLTREDAGEYKCEALVTDFVRPSVTHRLIVKTPPLIEHLLAKDNVTTVSIPTIWPKNTFFFFFFL